GVRSAECPRPRIPNDEFLMTNDECRMSNVECRMPLHHGRLYAVDGRQSVEQTFPAFAALAPDPDLAGGRAEVEGRGRKLIESQRITQHGVIGVFLGQSDAEFPPRVAAVFTAPNGRSAARAGA